MPHFFEFVHTLLEPMLGRNDILKMLPLVDDDLCELTELKKSEKIRLLAFKPGILQRCCHSSLSVLTNLLQPDMSIGLNNSYCWFFTRADRGTIEGLFREVAARQSDNILAALFDKFDVPVIGQALLEGIYTISSPRDIT